MWTGNLSCKLFKSEPPGEPVQKLNAWLHQEPMNTVAVSLYWGLLLLLLAPLAGMFMLWLALGQLIWWAIRTYIWPEVSVLEAASRDNAELAVVITGCDTGFGKDLVDRLAEKGFFVFAGCLQESSVEMFGGKQGKGNIKPLLLDVTKDDQVLDAAKAVDELLSAASTSKANRYLHGVVNNAGIGKVGYMDWISMQDYQQCMEVNCFGQIRMVKAFLPIFKRQAVSSRSKPFYAPQIINMISMAGTSRGGLALTPYETSKTAANAFTDGLRLEMKPWGIKVIDVNPSFHTTPLTINIYKKLQASLWAPLSDELKEEYGQDFFEGYAKHADRMMSQQWDPSITVDAMVNALLSKHPPTRINVGMDSRFGLLLYSMYPTWMRNLNTQLLMPDQTPAALRNAAVAKPTSKKDD